MGSLPQVVEDCFGLLKLYSDGSTFRSPDMHFDAPLLEDDTVLYKDFLFNKKHSLHLRLHRPKTTGAPTKLPVVYFFHGGGFCFGSRTFPQNHNMCLHLASVLQAVIIEPDHRLSPEHRLPAAVDDACCAIKWLQGQAMHEKMDTWLEGVDFDRVFVLGYSSGGNLAHHLAVQFGTGLTEQAPLRVRGYILLSPFFGGCVRTKSEEERPSEGFWTLDMYDRSFICYVYKVNGEVPLTINNRFWRLSVPTGSTQDHPLVNPFGPSSPSLAGAALEPILVVVGGDEILRDRGEEYARKLKELGKKIEYVELDGEQHGYFTDHPLSAIAEEVIQTIKLFMSDK